MLPQHTTRPRHPLAERFWAKVQKTDTCWLWTAHITTQGYGQISEGGDHGRRRLAHRVAYELAYGPIPAGLQVCHHCDVRTCVRPDHLFLGTAYDNIRDCIHKGRHVTTRQRKPIQERRDIRRYGEANGSAILTADQVRAIRRLHAEEGMSTRALGRMFGVSSTLVSRIVRRLAWAHLP